MNLPEPLATIIAASPDNVNAISITTFTPEFKSSLIAYMKFLARKMHEKFQYPQYMNAVYHFGQNLQRQEIVSACDYKVEDKLDAILTQSQSHGINDNCIRYCQATFHDSYMIRCLRCAHVYCHRHFTGIMLDAHVQVRSQYPIDFEGNDVTSIEFIKIGGDQFGLTKALNSESLERSLMYGSGLCQKCLAFLSYNMLTSSPSLFNEYELGILNFNRDEQNSTIKGLASLNEISLYGKNIIAPINIDELAMLVDDDVPFGFQAGAGEESFLDAREFISTWLPHLNKIIKQISGKDQVTSQEYEAMINQELLLLKDSFCNSRNMYELYEIIRLIEMSKKTSILFASPGLDINEPIRVKGLQVLKEELTNFPYKYGECLPNDCIKNKGQTLEYNLFQILMTGNQMDLYLDKNHVDILPGILSDTGEVEYIGTSFKRPETLLTDSPRFDDYCFHVSRYMKLLSWIDPLIEKMIHEEGHGISYLFFDKISQAFHRNPSLIATILPFKMAQESALSKEESVQTEDIERVISFIESAIKEMITEYTKAESDLTHSISRVDAHFLISFSMTDIITSNYNNYSLTNLTITEDNYIAFKFNDICLLLAFFGSVTANPDSNSFTIKSDLASFKHPNISDQSKEIDPIFGWDDELADNLSILLKNNNESIIIDLDEGSQLFRQKLLQQVAYEAKEEDDTKVLPDAFNETTARENNFKFIVSTNDKYKYPGISIALPNGIGASIFRNFSKELIDSSFVVPSSLTAAHLDVIQGFLNVMYCLPIIAQPYIQALETMLVKQWIDAAINVHSDYEGIIKSLICIYYPLDYITRRIFHDIHPLFIEKKKITKSGQATVLFDIDTLNINYWHQDGFSIIYLLMFLKDKVFNNYFSRYLRDRSQQRRPRIQDFNSDAIASIKNLGIESREDSYYTMDHGLFYALLTHLDLIDLKIIEYVQALKEKFNDKLKVK